MHIAGHEPTPGQQRSSWMLGPVRRAKISAGSKEGSDSATASASPKFTLSRPAQDNHNVRGRSATTIASFRTPSFSTTQRPMRGSRASAATSSTGASLSFAFPRRGPSAAPFTPSVSRGGAAHAAPASAVAGGRSSWSELTTPGAESSPASAKERSVRSSRQSRIVPSQEPVRVCASASRSERKDRAGRGWAETEWRTYQMRIGRRSAVRRVRGPRAASAQHPRSPRASRADRARAAV
jgi:hypothetical protein